MAKRRVSAKPPGLRATHKVEEKRLEKLLNKP